MALLKNKLFVSSFARTNCFVLKRVPHIWLILTLLTLFSFQRTPGHFSVTVPPRLQVDVQYNTWVALCQHVIFSISYQFNWQLNNNTIVLVFMSSTIFNFVHLTKTESFFRENKKHSWIMSALTSNYLSSQPVSRQVLSACKGLTTVFGMRTGGTP